MPDAACSIRLSPHGSSVGDPRWCSRTAFVRPGRSRRERRRSDPGAVQSSYSTSEALVRPWRTATLVATAVAAFELLILVGIAVALFGQPVLDWVQGSDSTPAVRTAKKKTHAAVKGVATPHPAPAVPQ